METLESYKAKLESLSATMESQQKLIHDTIGQQLSLKKEFSEKESSLNLKISSLENELKDKNAEIVSLESQLKDSKSQIERINAVILSNSYLGHTAGLMMDNDVSNAIQQLQAAQQQVVQQQFQQEIQQQVVLQQMQVIESLISQNSPPENVTDKMSVNTEVLEVTPPITPQVSKSTVLNPSPLSQVVSQNEFETNESEFMVALQDLSSSILEKDYKEPENKEMSIVSRNDMPDEWSPEQDSILKKTVGLHGHDWSIVTAFVPEKTAHECAYRWKTVVGKKVKGRWYKAEDAALLKTYDDYVKDHGPIKKNSITAWSAIAEKIPGRSGPACMVRYNESLDPRMKRGKWNSEEDELLRQGFEIHGASWVKIAEMIPGRTQRQCRTRHLILQGNMKRGNLLLEAQKEPREPTQYFSGMDDSDVENYSESDMASDFGF